MGSILGQGEFVENKNQEDAYAIETFEAKIGNDLNLTKIQYYGVFDGHSGKGCANYCAKNLNTHIQEQLKKKLPEGWTRDDLIFNALKLASVNVSEKFNSENPGNESGTTAAFVLIIDGDLWVANVGDSRAILVSEKEITPLTRDQKPDDPYFQRLIEKRGGEVTFPYNVPRVGVYGLAMARHWGKVVPGVSARPKITKIPKGKIPENSHLVIACDGVWDEASSKQIGNLVKNGIENGDPPSKMTQDIVQSVQYSAIKSEDKYMDNTTVIVCPLKKSKSKV